ncbi:MAG TPA: hypothetical protein VK523_04895 [Steroidobacteraceae bacterium]|nr:hypothetical protein [Steroidobacteraceae bacterium]
MSKKTHDDRSQQSASNAVEPAPPLLSEKLIAQLQGAVDAAQRKRMTHPGDQGKSRSAGQDF